MGKEFFEKFETGPAEGKEKPELEPEALPWRERQLKEDAELLSQFEKRAQLGDISKNEVSAQMRQEKDEDRMEAAGKWFKNNQREIQERDYDTTIKDAGYIYRAFAEMGGFESESAKNDPECQQISRAIEGIDILQTCLEKPQVSLKDQLLILNFLESRTKQMAEQLRQLEAGNDQPAIDGKKAELDKLFQTRKELFEKITGTNLQKEAEEGVKVKSLRGKMEQIREGIEEDVEEAMKNKKKELLNVTSLEDLKKAGLSFKEIDRILSEGFQKELGLDMEDRTKVFAWPPFKREAVFFKDKREIGRCGFGKEVGYLSEEMKKKFRKDLNSEIDERREELERACKEDVKDFMEDRIKTLAESPEKAIGGLSAAYAKRKEELATEHIREVRTRKNPGEIRKIEQEFSGQGYDFKEFINEVVNRKDGRLQNLEGTWNDDKEAIGDYLGDWGVSLSESELEKVRGRMEQKTHRNYETAVNKPRGLFEWFFDLIVAAFEPPPQAPSRKGGK